MDVDSWTEIIHVQAGAMTTLVRLKEASRIPIHSWVKTTSLGREYARRRNGRDGRIFMRQNGPNACSQKSVKKKTESMSRECVVNEGIAGNGTSILRLFVAGNADVILTDTSAAAF